MERFVVVFNLHNTIPIAVHTCAGNKRKLTLLGKHMAVVNCYQKKQPPILKASFFSTLLIAKIDLSGTVKKLIRTRYLL